MKKISKSLLNWLPAITLGIVLGSFLQLTQAWQEPGSNPPDSNIGAPVTTGSASQYKSGALGVNGLLRGYGKVMGNELCFGWDCRSDWQDLYKSGDKVCIESGNCVDVADNYIGDPGTHYAGGNLNMRGKDITNVDDVRLNDIYKDGWGDIDVYDDVDMKGNEITGLNKPSQGDEAANKEYVDDRTQTTSIDIVRRDSSTFTSRRTGQYVDVRSVDCGWGEDLNTCEASLREDSSSTWVNNSGSYYDNDLGLFAYRVGSECRLRADINNSAWVGYQFKVVAVCLDKG